MAKAKISIGGINYDVDLPNYASEETLQKLLKAVDKKFVQQTKKKDDELQKATKNAADAIDDTIDVLNQLHDSVEDVDDAYSDHQSKLSKFSSNLASYTHVLLSGISSMSAPISMVSNAALGFTKQLGNFTTGFFKKSNGTYSAGLSAVREVAGSLLSIAGGLIGFYIGQMDQLKESQKSFMDSGTLFSKGIDEATQLMNTSTIVSLKDMASAATNAKESLMQMSGGSAAGIKTLTKTINKFSNEELKNLLSLGYASDDMLESLSGFATQTAVFGKSLSTEELSKSSYVYLTNLKKLSILTGKSVKELNAQQESLKNDALIQKNILDISKAGLDQNIDPYLKVTKLIQSSFPAAGQAMSDLLSGSKNFTDSMLAIKSFYPGLEKDLTDITQALKTKKITTEEAYSMLITALDKQKDKAREVTDQFGELKDNLKGPAAEAVKMATEIASGSTRIKNAADAIKEREDAAREDAKRLVENRTPLSDALATYMKLEKETATSLSNIAFTLTTQLSKIEIQPLIDNFKAVAAEAKNLADAFIDLLKWFGYETAKEKEKKIQSEKERVEQAPKGELNINPVTDRMRLNSMTTEQLDAIGLVKEATKFGMFGQPIEFKYKAKSAGKADRLPKAQMSPIPPTQIDDAFKLLENIPQLQIPKKTAIDDAFNILQDSKTLTPPTSIRPQNQALGGIIQHDSQSGTTITAAEKSNEAFVPLPDGRSIPVTLASDSIFEEIRDKLSALLMINTKTANLLERNNSLTKQMNNIFN